MQRKYYETCSFWAVSFRAEYAKSNFKATASSSGTSVRISLVVNTKGERELQATGDECEPQETTGRRNEIRPLIRHRGPRKGAGTASCLENCPT